MSTDASIRTATFDDIDGIASLYIEQFRAMAALSPYFVREGEQSKTFIRSIIEDENADILVCLSDEGIVGLTLLQTKETSDYSCIVKHRFAYLMDIVVSERHRGGGIGTALMDAAKAWAKARSLEYIELDVLSNNENAIRFYDRHGFMDKRKTVYCRL